jgi:TonB-linked SusC/RagA family outer membrane protein
MKKVKKATLLITLALINIAIVYAQQKTVIRGRVIDKNDKSAVVGANIVEYDKDNRVINGTVCNVNGDFVLEMKNLADIVKVSFIGYTALEIKVDPSKVMTVELESSSHVMEEVVVTAQAKGYSLTNLDDRDKASSSVKMDLRDMKESGALSVADALQGRVSGLDILNASGDPGSGSRIVIRGLSSIGNSKPLIVIDGVQQSRVPSDFNLGSANAEDIGTLINVPVQDIKSVEILKDAAATAVYGSKGADGVLLIETHKGRKGNVKLEYTYKGSLNFQPPAIPMLNGDEYIMLQREELHNSQGIYTIPSEISYDKSYPDFYNYSQNTDWIGAITQNAVTNDHYLSVSGGGEKATYFTSLSYVNEGGTTIKTGSKSFSTRVKLDYMLSKKMTFNINFSYTHNLTNDNMDPNGRNIREMAYIKAPNMSIWEYDSNGKLTGEYFSRPNSYQGDGMGYYNPVAVANLGKKDRLKNALSNSFQVLYHINKWLTFTEIASIEIQGEKDNSFLPYNAIGSDWYSWTVNKAEEVNKINQSFQTNSQLAFNNIFPNSKHDLSGALTWKTEQQRYEDMNVQSNMTPSVDIQDPAINGQINWIGSNLNESKFLEGVLSVNYKYADKYLMQLTLTEDAHTSFGSNHRWGLFKGLSGAWRFSEEPFLKGISFLGESKLRLSWGLVGRQPSDNYARFATYSDPSGLGFFQNKWYTQLAGVPKTYMGYTAVVPLQIQLNNLQWESTATTNIGLDLSLFQDRFYATAEVYNKVTSNLLFDHYLIPTSTGFEILKYLNGGKLSNKGWEVMMDYKFIRNKDWTCSINLNVSQNKNSFVELPANLNKEASTSIENGAYPKILVEGEPIGSFYGFKYKGIYASDKDAVAKDANGNTIYDNEGAPIPMTYKGSYVFRGGDAKYEDINHDGKIDLNDVVYLGNSNPKLYGGFGPTIKYKNFSMSCNFQFRVGYNIVNNIALQTQGMNDKNNQSKAVLRRWRSQGQDEPGMLPRAYMQNPANNLGSDRYVENGDFLRLVNVMVGYSLGSKACSKLHVNTLRMTLSGRKLATFTNYTGQDPEVSTDASDPFWIGVDNSRTPPPRIITFALTIGL